MDLERVGEYFGRHKPILQRAFWVDQIQRGIKEEFGETVKVILRGERVIITCHSSAQLTFLSLRLAPLEQIVKKVIGRNRAVKLTVSD